MKREFLQNLGDLPKEMIDAIMAENGRDIEAARQAGRQWEDKYNQAVADHEKQLAELRLHSALESAVTRLGGRNVKAISALLDMDDIRASDDVPAALETALTALKKENGYLFAVPQAPPYARGTGSAMPESAPVTLADALRQRAAGQ